jgi:predicted PurR-regulated permease PerM
MKPEFNKRNNTLALYALTVLLVVMLCIFIFLNFGAVWTSVNHVIGVFMPIFYGAMIAYLLCPGVKFFEKRVFRGLNRKKLYGFSRVLAVVAVFLAVVISIGLFCWLVLPRVLAGYADLQKMSNLYIETLREWVLDIPVGENFFSRYVAKLLEYFVGLLDKLYATVMSSIPDVMDVATMLVGILGDLFLGIILSVYFLLARERLQAQAKKVLRAFLNTDKYRVFAKSTRLADRNFGGYIKGQIADAIVIGAVSYLCLLIIGIPYYPLVSALVGIASLIPVFGTLIGTVIGALIIFLVKPMASIWFALFMIALHMVNKYMIRPYVIRVGVDASTMFMFAAIIIMTGLIGFWGLLIGVPVFAVLYSFMHSIVDRKLKYRGLSAVPLDYYDTETGKALYLERERRRTRRKRKEKEEEQEEDFRLKKPESEPQPSASEQNWEETESTDTEEITVHP